jgi:hypothetical protein
MDIETIEQIRNLLHEIAELDRQFPATRERTPGERALTLLRQFTAWRDDNELILRERFGYVPDENRFQFPFADIIKRQEDLSAFENAWRFYNMGYIACAEVGRFTIRVLAFAKEREEDPWPIIEEFAHRFLRERCLYIMLIEAWPEVAHAQVPALSAIASARISLSRTRDLSDALRREHGSALRGLLAELPGAVALYTQEEPPEGMTFEKFRRLHTGTERKLREQFVHRNERVESDLAVSGATLEELRETEVADPLEGFILQEESAQLNRLFSDASLGNQERQLLLLYLERPWLVDYGGSKEAAGIFGWKPEHVRKVRERLFVKLRKTLAETD